MKGVFGTNVFAVTAKSDDREQLPDLEEEFEASELASFCVILRDDFSGVLISRE